MHQAVASGLVITVIITILSTLRAQAGCTSVKRGITHLGVGNNPGCRH